MKHKILLLVFLLALGAQIAACAPRVVSGASNETNVSGEDGAVEDQTELIEALQATGAEVELGDTLEQAFFSVPGQILKINGIDVQVFEYESAEAMGIEASQVSKDGSSIGTSMVTWVEAPHFFRSGRMLVLYVGEEAVTLDLLRSVLGDQFAGR